MDKFNVMPWYQDDRRAAGVCSCIVLMYFALNVNLSVPDDDLLEVVYR